MAGDNFEDDETEDMFDDGAEVVALDRTLREADGREAEARPRSWKPVSRLPDPPERAGWVHRYIRRSIRNDLDSAGYSRAMQEGWEPCRPEDYPEFGAFTGARADGDSSVIEFGGLVLCRMPKEMADERKAYFENRARKQIGAVNERLTGVTEDGKLAIHNRSKSSVSKKLF